MGKVSMQDLDKYRGSGSGAFFSLKNDKDTAKVRFMISDTEDLNDYIFAVHGVKVPGSDYPKDVNCLREYDDPVDDCPFCAANIPLNVKLYLPLYDVDDDSVKVWGRGKKFISKMTSLCTRYKNLVSHTFDIERNGEKGDQRTTYEIYEVDSDDTELEDLPDVPEILGDKFLLDKSAEEMELYLETGSFAPEEDEPAPRRRSKRIGEDDEEEEEERPRRRHVDAEDRGRCVSSKERRRPRKEDKF